MVRMDDGERQSARGPYRREHLPPLGWGRGSDAGADAAVAAAESAVRSLRVSAWSGVVGVVELGVRGRSGQTVLPAKGSWSPESGPWLPLPFVALVLPDRGVASSADRKGAEGVTHTSRHSHTLQCVSQRL